MKKIFSFVLAAVMVMSMVGCGSEEKETLKMGLGVYSYVNGYVDADADNYGSGDVIATVAAVTLDKDGKIVACDLDTLDAEAEFTADGKAAAAEDVKTKYQKGSDYGMVAYGDATKEWFEQADAFEEVVVGKTIDEVKALLGEDYYTGTDEVIKAGCTIGVTDFISAIEMAVANAEDSSATSADTLQVGVVTNMSGEDASEEADGSVEVDVTFAAAAVDKDGKVDAMEIDTLAVTITFDTKGVYTGITDFEVINTKQMLGENYGMAAYGADLNGDGEVKEWFEQADAFAAACVGKTASEIAGLNNGEGYGVEDVQKAGCTIGVTAFVEAAVKAATIG